jgi:hypothetical protein
VASYILNFNCCTNATFEEKALRDARKPNGPTSAERVDQDAARPLLTANGQALNDARTVLIKHWCPAMLLSMLTHISNNERMQISITSK